MTSVSKNRPTDVAFVSSRCNLKSVLKRTTLEGNLRLRLTTEPAHVTQGATSAAACALPVTQSDVCAGGRCVTHSQTKLFRYVIVSMYYVASRFPVYFLQTWWK
ncbi:hypothetical protein ElyMa_001482200 [Elysia marginata]|uniref:Uncharacterized protein n=1 Tax=Elysia marginata TaxID=1093978 RepID=A0AAV4J218_9GAST|nr:hypothetical protein ElyMa_001482200 [Elysia marginata]